MFEQDVAGELTSLIKVNAHLLIKRIYRSNQGFASEQE